MQTFRKPDLSLSVSHPEIAKGWHPIKNDNLTPEDVSASSRKKFWWRCLKNPAHEWRQNVYRQLNHKCAFCAMEKNNLQLRFPAIALEWHPSKNGLLTPDSVAPHSNRVVWWQCPRFEDHSWEASLISRTSRGVLCPYCSGRRADTRNSLAARDPDLALQWHPTRNGELRPDDVVWRCYKKVWWICKDDKSHEWLAPVANRSLVGTGCPTCARVNSENNLEKLFPEIAKEWHPTKNGHLYPSWDPDSQKKKGTKKNRRLQPRDFAAYSNVDVYWQCPKFKEHVYSTEISNRTKNRQNCPFCAHVRVAEDNCLQTNYPSLVKWWHPTRNLPLTPKDVTPGAEKKVWWRCLKSPFHVWQQSVCVVVRSYVAKTRGCPFCTGRRICQDNNLAAKFPEVSKLWHPVRNASLKPTDFLPGSDVVVWWQCAKNAEHSWKAPVSRVVHNRNTKSRGCKFCSGLETKKEESFAAKYPELLKFWDKSRNLDVTPKKVSAGSHRKVYWRCPQSSEHVWRIPIKAMIKRQFSCTFCAKEQGIKFKRIRTKTAK